MICCPGADIDFSKFRIQVAHGSGGVIIHVGGDSIINRDETFERSEIILKKYRKLVVRTKEIRKRGVCKWNFIPGYVKMRNEILGGRLEIV